MVFPLADTDLGEISAFLSPVFGLLGVLLGALLNRRSTLAAARDEREHASKQEVHRRKEEAAARLDAAVLEINESIPSMVDENRIADELQPAYTALIQARAQSAVLVDREVDRRFQATLMTLGMATRAYARRRHASESPSVNLWPISVAMRELREALVYYQQRDIPPPAKYPTSKELIAIVHKAGGNRFDAINDWLIEHEVA